MVIEIDKNAIDNIYVDTITTKIPSKDVNETGKINFPAKLIHVLLFADHPENPMKCSYLKKVRDTFRHSSIKKKKLLDHEIRRIIS